MTERPRFRQYFSVEEAERLITDLWDLALRIDDADDIPTVTRDPNGDYLIALARKSGADVLVTGDRDPLDLQQADVEVIAPREFVEQLDTREVAVEERPLSTDAVLTNRSSGPGRAASQTQSISRRRRGFERLRRTAATGRTLSQVANHWSRRRFSTHSASAGGTLRGFGVRAGRRDRSGCGR